MGQGNGAGPSIWSIISSTVFEELKKRGLDTEFGMAISTGLYKLCGFSYVDDCDLIADGETSEEVHHKIKHMIDLWDRIMEVNGAAIAPDKCWWYSINFKWTNGKWKYEDAGTDIALTVRDKNNVERILPTAKSSEAMKMVGVHLAPDGNESEQLTQLCKKAQKWANQIIRSPLDDGAVWIALHQTITRGIEYPLAATTLDQQALNRALVQVRSVALPRSGFTRKFPHAVLYGPVAVQGLGLPDPYIYQYCRHVQDIVSQGWRGTPTGQLIKANLEAIKVEAGLYDHLFDQDLTVTWFNTTNSWVIETYKFCRQRDIVFEEPGKTLKPRCQGDDTIMNQFAIAGYSSKDLTILNRCRLFCQVDSISDVAEGNGIFLSERWITTHTPESCCMESSGQTRETRQKKIGNSGS